jgi:intein-encoded DNA endonuclease-like protein
MKDILKLLYAYSQSKTLSDFQEWIKQKSGFKIEMANLSRWMSGKHEPSNIYKQIIKTILEKEI